MLSARNTETVSTNRNQLSVFKINTIFLKISFKYQCARMRKHKDGQGYPIPWELDLQELSYLAWVLETEQHIL